MNLLYESDTDENLSSEKSNMLLDSNINIPTNDLNETLAIPIENKESPTKKLRFIEEIPDAKCGEPNKNTVDTIEYYKKAKQLHNFHLVEVNLCNFYIV